MHNCIPSRVGEALRGLAFLYHGEVGRKPLSIQIARRGDGYRLVEAAGTSNAGVRAAQKRVLREFLSHLRSCACEVTSTAVPTAGMNSLVTAETQARITLTMGHG